MPIENNDIKELSINFLKDINARFEDGPEKIKVGLSSLARLSALMLVNIEEPFRNELILYFLEGIMEGLENLDQKVVPEFFANEVIKKAMKK